MLTFYEEQEISDSILIYEQLESDYKTYCESCTDEPLSFECWVHTDISSNDNVDDLPF